MAALLKVPFEREPIEQQVSPELLGMVNRLRFCASICRASAYLDILEACRLIDPRGEQDAEQSAHLLVRVLRQALDRAPVWHRPGNPELSFDELWLAQVIDSYRRDDTQSYDFLTKRRIAKENRRLFTVLVGNLARNYF